MPWGRLRTSKTENAKSLRRYSQLEAPNLAVVPVAKPDSHYATKTPSPLRQSFEPNHPREQASLAQLEPLRRDRFSMLTKRHVSDPQISRTARDQAISNANAPPVPAGPFIVTTTPPEASDAVGNIRTRPALSLRNFGSGKDASITAKSSQQSLSSQKTNKSRPTVQAAADETSSKENNATSEDPGKPSPLHAPPPYGEDAHSSLALPVSRLSESSRSDGSLGEPVFASTTTHTVSTTTTLFRLPRRKKKDKGPLFPLPVKIPSDASSSTILTPRLSTSARPSESSRQHSPTRSSPLTTVQLAHGGDGEGDVRPSAASPTSVSDHPLPRNAASTLSNASSSLDGPPNVFGPRSRSSTHQQNEDDGVITPPVIQSARTSSSTGRGSLGGLFGMSRNRQNSEPQQLRYNQNHPPLPGTPLSTGSKSNSFTIPREPLVIPERLDGETPARYLARLEETISRGLIAAILSHSDDDFMKNVLRSYMRGFSFFGDPLDMSTRKLLMKVELPKETQQIDRVLQSFANRYHECNPGIYATPDEAYFIAFSILILHTDVFNKNNKSKMQRSDYTKNARGQGVADEVLECFYDNITYTPFIHVDDDLDLNGDRTFAGKSRKSVFSKPHNDLSGRLSREPVDPYILILDNSLDLLRPSLREVMNLEDYYNYQGTGAPFKFGSLYRSFFRYGTLQIMSSRSRPEAFMSPETMANPALTAEAHPGVVDIKVTKVGILWRKDTKKKKTRSPWQEWGAILTGAQLYFFRNATWIKALMNQHDHHRRHSIKGPPVVFKPPLEQFKPDVLMSTEDAVALRDSSYKKHKNALVFIRHGGLEEVFLADSDSELNDWLLKLNYAAAFRTAGVRIRGTSTAPIDTSKLQSVHRIDSARTTESSTTSQEVISQESVADTLAQQIRHARRQIMAQKVAEADIRLKDVGKLLDIQLRNARHLQILAPIQNRTREQVLLAAGGMSAKVKWTRIDMWRTRCHRDVLASDLEDDSQPMNYPNSGGATETPQTARRGNVSDNADGQDTSPPIYHPSKADARPVTQPSPTKGLGMDDVFASLQRSSFISNHKQKGSWELPPLNFQQTRTSLKSASSRGTSQQLSLKQISSRAVSDISGQQGTDEDILKATRSVSAGENIEKGEQEALKDAGVVLTQEKPVNDKPNNPEPSTPVKDEDPSTTTKTPETDGGGADNKAKLRRSLQRTLRETNHVPGHLHGHARSKKGRDSSSGAALSLDGAAARIGADSEGLTRSTGSFNFHGKKASVINFGSEWQSLSPDERLKSRRQDKETPLAKIDANEDADGSSPLVSSSLRSQVNRLSVGSSSSATDDEGACEEAKEDVTEDVNANVNVNDAEQT